MTDKRKCCSTPRGPGPHKPDCHQGRAVETLGQSFDRDGIPKQVRRQILDEIGDDLPDGAYFALASEMGIELEDFLEETEL